MKALYENSEQWFLSERPGEGELLEDVGGHSVNLCCVGFKSGWGWINVIYGLQLNCSLQVSTKRQLGGKCGAGLIQTDHIWRWRLWGSLEFVSWTAGHDAKGPGRATKELEWLTYNFVTIHVFNQSFSWIVIYLYFAFISHI